MSTKLRATVKSIDQSSVALVFDGPYHTILNPEDGIFVELHTIQGNKVEFHTIETPTQAADTRTSKEPKIDGITQPNEQSGGIPTDTAKPIKEAKSSKKK